MNRGRLIFIFLFFTVQLIGIFKCLDQEIRFFTWSPYDQISMYNIEVYKDKVFLDEAGIYDRYGLSKSGRENRSIHHVFRLIQVVENELQDSVVVTINYSINGQGSLQWKYGNHEEERF